MSSYSGYVGLEGRHQSADWSDEEKAGCDQQLSQIIEGQIGDPHGEFLFLTESIKNQDNIGQRKQYSSNGMHPGSSSGCGENISDCNRGHQNDGTYVQHTENLECQLYGQCLKDPGKQQGSQNHTDHQTGNQILRQGNDGAQIQDMSCQKCDNTQQEDFLTNLGEHKPEVQENVT